MKMNAKTLSTNQKIGNTACSIGGPNSGPSQPPKNSRVATLATVTMLAYSAMKNMANFIALYSVWYPATSSVSASGKSNGMRLVSAYAAVTYVKNAMNWGNMFQRGTHSSTGTPGNQLPAC